MTIRLSLAGAAGALLALAPAPVRAQEALVAERPAALTTFARDTAATDVAPPRPNETVRVAPAPSYRRYAVRGTLIGTGVGLAVGALAHRNNERKCHGCVGNDAIPFIVSGAGAVLGFVGGSVAWLVRADAKPAEAGAGAR